MFKLATPWALILLILPLALWFLVKKAPVKCNQALKLPFFDAASAWMQGKNMDLLLKKQLVLFSAIWILLVLAVSKPQWEGPPLPFQREGHNIMLVLDISGSMALGDMLQNGRPATRLMLVKTAAKKFVEARSNDKIGLILFGSLAYLQTPLTWDHQNVLTRIEDAEPGLAGNTTSVGDALGLAVKHLKPVAQKSPVIILLTDGASNSGFLTPLKAAELAASETVKIYTIGLGAEMDPLAGNLFTSPSADLDEATLKRIADLTGGRYFRATDAKSLQSIYQTIDKLETVRQEGPVLRPQKNYYPWLLSPALFLLFAFFFKEIRKRHAHFN